MKTKVKVSSITNLTEARYYASAGAEWLGFSFDEKDPRYISPENAKEILEWIEGPKLVGEYGDIPKQEIMEIHSELDLSGWVLPFSRKDLFNSQPLNGEKMLIIDQVLTDDLKPALAAIAPDQLIILTDSPSSDDKARTEYLIELGKDHKIILSVDPSKDDVLDLVGLVRPYGINIPGGEEDKTGMKKFDQVTSLFELLDTKL